MEDESQEHGGQGQAAVMWASGQIAVDLGQGPKRVDDIGAALQMILDSYKEASEGRPGESGFMAAFANDTKQQDRQPTQGDSAAASRF